MAYDASICDVHPISTPAYFWSWHILCIFTYQTFQDHRHMVPRRFLVIFASYITENCKFNFSCWHVNLSKVTDLKTLVQNGVSKWNVKMGCHNGASKWGVKMECQNRVSKCGVKMKCQNGVSKWGVKMECQNRVSKWGVKMGCQNGVSK